jgi:hypothetical protein
MGLLNVCFRKVPATETINVLVPIQPCTFSPVPRIAFTPHPQLKLMILLEISFLPVVSSLLVSSTQVFWKFVNKPC